MEWNAGLAYDLKLIIEKGLNDVIKPSWITDSIALGERAPFHHKFVLFNSPHVGGKCDIR